MNNKQRITLSKLVIGALLFFLLLRLLEHTLLSGLGTPSLFTVDLDLTYWFFKDSGIPDWLMRHRIVTALFDGCLLASGMLAFCWPLKRWFLVVFAFLLFYYCLIYDLYASDHFSQVNGLMIVLLPFLLTDNRYFTLAWEGMRYFTCLIYFLAFFWKTCYGNAFYYLHQGASTFKSNLVDYMSLNPDTAMTAFYKFFLRHDWLLNAGEKMIVLTEGLMVIGLFTKKYDRTLIWGPVFIHVLTYFFADVFFIELLVIDLSFLSVRQINWFAALFTRRQSAGRISSIS